MAVVEHERRENVMLVTLNRPEARNAISSEVSAAMVPILDAAEADDDVRAVVLTGAGDVFCAGADLKEIATGKGAGIMSVKGHFAGIVQRELSVP